MRSRSTHCVAGRVLVAGTKSPVSGVVAQLHAVPPKGTRRSLGSTIVEKGAFRVDYSLADDEEAASVRLQVSIVAPGTARGSVTLAQSEIRKAAAAREYFLLAVDAEKLAESGTASALAAASRSDDPKVAARSVAVKRERTETRRIELVTERKKSVEAQRVRDAAQETILRETVLARMTGVKPGSGAWKRMVPPGETADEVTRKYQGEALSLSISPFLLGNETRTFLALSDEERDALGTPPDPKKVETLLRRRGKAEISRDDALRTCLPEGDEPVAENPSPGGGGGETDPATSDTDAKVNQLIEAIVPPDELRLEGPLKAGEVAGKILGLKLAKGPADVPAYYDFHRLELAFEHVWEDARAHGYIQKARQLYRAAEDLGGDPEAALASKQDPLGALRKEVRLGMRAAAALGAASGSGPPGYLARDNPLPINTPGYGSVFEADDIYVFPVEDPPPPPPPTDPDIAPDLDDFHAGYDWDDDRPPPPPPEGDYPFTLFAAGSVNFGLLVTYQQCFEPTNYQVGRLVGTRTLGPKESYSFTTRQVIKTSYNRKQISTNQQMRKDESETTYRDEAEIVNRAQTKTNFALSTSGSYDLGPLGEGTATTSLGRDAETSSQETKRAQRSAIQRAAQEARNEQRIELESTQSVETETTEKREINNPNDELALTCVFYELQRRYRLSERLYRVTPVLLVAQHVPRPEEINDAWILRHDWIIRRFLPDDSFQGALTYLATRAAGDAVILADLQTHMNTLRGAVGKLTNQIASVRSRAEQQLRELQNFVNNRANIAAEEDSEGWLEGAWEAVAGAGGESLESIRILEEAARERYEKALRDETDLRTRLDREATALQVATDEYVKALAEHSNRRVEVDRLIRHVRAYILHYMQGIWSYEHPDQRFFRHHNLTAPRLPALERTYQLQPLNHWPVGVTPQPGKRCYAVTYTTNVDPDVETESKRATLSELVDLDRMLGFKGNYIIYPLKESNGLTDYMMTPYLDPELGVRDPDEVGNWTLDEFEQYVECLKKRLGDAGFAEVAPALEEQRKRLLMSPHRNGEHVVIPSNSLYMQMLVDSGKALEGFKEAHRLMDVMKVKAEVRGAELENLRRAKLVLANQLEDPEVESVKNVYYRGPAPHDGDE